MCVCACLNVARQQMKEHTFNRRELGLVPILLCLDINKTSKKRDLEQKCVLHLLLLRLICNHLK